PNSLRTHAFPILGDVPVDAVDTALVTRVLQPIWTTLPETASRVRGRIERIIDWAAARKYREGENPARWRGHLEVLLPPRKKMAVVKHLQALAYREIGLFMAELRQDTGVAAAALEFTILTAARTGEVLGARWEEINLAERIWIVPPERMKAAKEHR